MFAFLAVVAENDLKKGIIEPSYILCKTNSKNGTTAGYRITAADSKFRNMTKVLVTSYVGHEDLIEYMTAFRTVRYYRGHDRYRKIVHGAMFWFPCNEYGERNNQPPVFITRVPVKGRIPEQGKQRMESARKKEIISFNEVLAQEPDGIEPEFFNVKKKMPETSIERRNQDDENDECEDDGDYYRKYREQWGEVGFRYTVPSGRK